jgi:hypothetical protein
MNTDKSAHDLHSQTTENTGSNAGPDLFEAGDQNLEISQDRVGLATVPPVLNQQAVVDIGQSQQPVENKPLQEPVKTTNMATESGKVLSQLGEQGQQDTQLQTAPALNYRKLTVTLKPVTVEGPNLGLALTQEKFVSMPGTKYSWAPFKKGNTYRTGLNRVEVGATEDERREVVAGLEEELGRKLDASFYNDLNVSLDRNKKAGERLNLAKAFDFVVFLAMLESPQVANGLHEKRDGTKPQAEWYVENKEAEAEKEALERTQKITVLSAFGQLSNHKKRKIAILAGVNVLGLSDMVVEGELWKWIDKAPSPKEEQRRIGLFIFWVKSGDTYIDIAAMVEEAILFNVIRLDSAKDYRYGDNLLGATKEEITERLTAPRNSELRMGIKSRVENAKNMRA